jgi:hypothetical protein
VSRDIKLAPSELFPMDLFKTKISNSFKKRTDKATRYSEIVDTGVDSESLGGLINKPSVHFSSSNSSAKPERTCNKIFRSKYFWVLLCGILIMGCLANLTNIYRPKANREILHCGSHPQEARDRGCEYSLMDGKWVPSLCYAKDMDEEWANRGWSYFEDKNGTRRISQDIVKTGNLDYWVITEHHLGHCINGLRQLRNGYISRTTVPSYILEDEHFDHCVGMIRDRSSKLGMSKPDAISTNNIVDYTGCSYV